MSELSLQECVRPNARAPHGERSSSTNARLAGQLADAEHLTRTITSDCEMLDIFLPLIEESSLPDMLIVSLLARARIAQMNGHLNLACDLLDELEQLGERRQLPRVVASAMLEKSRLTLRTGKPGEAQRHLDLSVDGEGSGHPPSDGACAGDVGAFDHSVCPRGLLSPREIEVLVKVAEGLSNKKIARDLFRSETTVATHLRNIYAKLEAGGRMQAILLARQRGLLP